VWIDAKEKGDKVAVKGKVLHIRLTTLKEAEEPIFLLNKAYYKVFDREKPRRR